MSGTLPLLPYTPSWPGERKLYPFLPFASIVSFTFILLFNFTFVYFIGCSHQFPLKVHARVDQVSCVERVLILTHFY